MRLFGGLGAVFLLGLHLGDLFSGLLTSVDGTDLGGSVSELFIGCLNWALFFLFLFFFWWLISWRIGLGWWVLRSSVWSNLSGVGWVFSCWLLFSLWRSWWCDLTLVGEELFHLLVLLNELILGLLEKADSKFIVNERDDHIVVKRNHVRRNVVVHLLHALHENEGSVGGESVLASLGDGPALILGVGNGTVVSRDGFQLDLDVSLHGSSDGVDELLAISVDVDLVLDVVDVLVGTDPGWSGSQVREVLSVDIEVFVRWSHEVEALRWSLSWDGVVDSLVKVVVNDLSEIDDTSFLNLNFRSFVKLHSGSMDETEISDVVLSTNIDDHELSFPKLLVVWNLVVVGLTFANFENTSVTLESDLDILELLSVDTLKFELESLFRDRIWSEDHLGLLQKTWVVEIFAWHIFERKVAENFVVFEVLESWVGVIDVGSTEGVLVGVDGTFEVGLIELELVLKGAVANLVQGFVDEVRNDFFDDLWGLIDAYDMVGLMHDQFVTGLLGGPEVLDLVDLTELSDGLEELIGSTSLLWLEEGKPEDLGVNAVFKGLDNITAQIVVDDIFEIDVIEFVSPWMKNLEAFVIHVLLSESLDILLDELKISLVGLDWVAEIILVDGLLVISQEGTNGLDARSTLKILRAKKLVKVLLERRSASVGTDFKELKNSHEDLLEALEIPVLVDDGVNNSGVEDLLSLVGEQVHEVVHLVDCLSIFDVLLAPLWKQLLTDEENQVFDILVTGEVLILSGVLKGHLDLVHEGSAHREDHGKCFLAWHFEINS